MGKKEQKHSKNKKDKKKQSSSSSSSSSSPPAAAVLPAAPPPERRVFFKRSALPAGSATFRMLHVSVLKEILYVIRPETLTGEDNTPIDQVNHYKFGCSTHFGFIIPKQFRIWNSETLQ
jgi:hypothetical protein